MLVVWCSLLLQFLAAASAVLPECSVDGCAAAVRPVCGSDGLTYMNTCLAACQGVTIARHGSCVPEKASDGASTAAIHIPAALFVAAVDGDVAATSAARILPAAAISAYHSEGMRMVGMLKRSSFQTGMPVLTEDALALMQMNSSAPASVTTMMVNSKGHLYAAPLGTQLWGAAAAHQEHLVADSAAIFSAPSEATAPLEAETYDSWEDGAVAGEPGSGASTDAYLSSSRPVSAAPAAAGGSRKLQGIIGQDTRKELRTTPKYPLSAAGHLMFTNPDDSKRYQCSGTLVGTYVVLTAAHCVVARSGEVQQEITFTAAETSRNHGGLGAANGVRVYFNSGYLSLQDWTNWDLGLVVLDQPLGLNSHEAFQQEWEQLQVSVSARRGFGGPRSHRGDDGRQGDRDRETAASVPGTVGYAASPRLDGRDLISAGYPGDKPLGSAWMMSCSLTDKGDASSNVLPNKCPIVNGQSGASLIEGRPKGDGTRYYARGIVSFEVCQSVCDAACCGGKVQYNGVLKITPYFQGFIDTHRNFRPNSEDSEFE